MDLLGKTPGYDMPGGKGSMEKIIGTKYVTFEGNSESGMTAEEHKLSKAKETYKEAVKEEAEARAEYEISPTDENKVKLDEAKVKLDSAKGQLEQAKQKAEKKK
ncbi:hypothetical protein [Campylobacter sp. RM16188]|uniref:hypothetical protein n=1 Tax=Campylobacter sp. RM16188 TaxID=1705725 RepID=UPI001554CA8E|nr:hypothetical protein [Campylobacter sp. RM16188]